MLSDRITELRKRKGLTQSEMSRRLGVHRGTYSNYESGKREPDHDMTVKIANFFEVTTDFLLGKSNEPQLSEEEDQALTHEAIRFIEKLNSLPADKREKYEERIRAYLKGLEDAIEDE